ncbi:hypothetical protein LPB19_14820 [Marinobacter salinisoli]|uniref:ATPase n=1 Tax=Marinobacter salinisoli TaxID=2769486 RepID=A0ABX7MQ31_9GAMM|nr:hypothetical protein [Marinobacter salinisoli]QSP94432.1 hypothetical protein LPB19_14820 [Marinobacter salinisoli]
MEPIRPDDDELRAEAPIVTGQRDDPSEKTAAAANRGTKAKQGEAPSNRSGNGSGGGGRSLTMLWLLFIAVACVALAGWYSQSQRIKALEGQLEEADYWARQSKLALARVEGELSETGESLEERGATLGEQIASNQSGLKAANSEIRKLWVVANERNKARLNEHEEQLVTLEQRLAEDAKALTALQASVESVRTSLAADLAALESQSQTSISALEETAQQLTGQLTGLTQKMAEVDQLVEARIRRFEQEQKLTASGVESRLSSLEQKTSSAAGQGSVQALQREVAGLEKTVAAIDASRSQLTSRLVRLSEEVNALRAQVSAN